MQANPPREQNQDSEIPNGRFWRSVGFQKWLEKRSPASKSITLSQRNIFIMPSKNGLYFVSLIFFMMLAAINYQNSLIFALAFLLTSLFMVSILHTYRNLSGLNIEAGSPSQVFAGEHAEFQVHLSRHGRRTYEAVVLGWSQEFLQDADLIEDSEVRVKLFVETRQRGLLNPGRLLIQTHYPVGLFRAWSWVDLGMSALVYPKPIAGPELPAAQGLTDEGSSANRAGVEDFYGLRSYQRGDSLHQIAWKSFARTNELLVKEFSAELDQKIWLDWDFYPGMDTEARLSRLCHWVLKLSQTTAAYGLRLPGVEIQPANNAGHKASILKELAVFEGKTSGLAGKDDRGGAD